MKIGTDMKYNYLILALAAITLLSCAREQADVPETITIRAYQEGAAETRTTLIDGGTQVYWEPSDEIKVFFNGVGGRFAAQNTENVTVATFSGSINVLAGANEGASSNYMTWGLYPYRSDATSDGESVTTTLPSEQTGRSGSFAKNTHITLAQSEGLNLAFYNVTGGIRFSLTTEGIKEVVFQGQNDEDIVGKVKLAFVNGIPAVQEVLDGQKSITLTAPGGGTFETGKWYYIVTLPGTLSNGFKMTFNTETQYATLKSSGSKTIKRGIFGSLADADEDLIYKDKEGGDNPNPEDVIQFEDPIAKYACVDKFDTNKDGEISYAEAAAVTSLEGLFTDWNTVTSFDEIRYFTSVTSTEKVFTGLAKLTHITIPDNITTLGTFSGCTALETVALPASLNELPAYCFSGCSSLKSVTLPTGITSIPNYAFRNCSALMTLVIPYTVTSIAQYAFAGCSVLTGVELPSGCRTIGRYAFSNCNGIVSMDFPASLSSIGEAAFSGCTALNSIVLPNGVSLVAEAFSGCTMLASVVLPADMTVIPDNCFYNCTKLASISWPDALTTIGSYAFSGCRFGDNNSTLQLPASVESIGIKAFGGIRHLILPSLSVISISPNSFVKGYTFLYVPANMVEMLKVRTNWSNFADKIRPMSDYPVSSTVGGTVGEAVDLGLSVKWATWNVGASAPEESGAYFAWGEIEPKEMYSWENYQWCNGSEKTLTMYNTKSDYGSVDNKKSLDPEDDAAHVIWGGSWRMPTLSESRELYNNCTREWVIINGVNGYRMTSKKDGYTDKSIFLPATGTMTTQLFSLGVGGCYWLSSIYSTPSYAYNIYFQDYFMYDDQRYFRYEGNVIRPVCD